MHVQFPSDVWGDKGLIRIVTGQVDNLQTGHIPVYNTATFTDTANPSAQSALEAVQGLQL